MEKCVFLAIPVKKILLTTLLQNFSVKMLINFVIIHALSAQAKLSVCLLICTYSCNPSRHLLQKKSFTSCCWTARNENLVTKTRPK